jgi:hypothetical protein
MSIKHHFLWIKMKYWQWRNGVPVPKEKVDLLLLRYGAEHKRWYENINKTDPNDFHTKEAFIQELARKQIAARQHFDQFVNGFKRAATTTESKAVLAEVRWLIEFSTSSWGYTLEDVRERREFREVLGPQIQRMGRQDRIADGMAPWYEHLEDWYDRFMHHNKK